MRGSTKLAAAAASIAIGALGATAAVVSAHPNHRHHPGSIQHVLLISMDGLHQSDLEWCIANNVCPELAKLTAAGAEYSNAHTVVPSDSDPGGTALMTGGDPRATGVYYDDEYNHDVYPAGTTNCTGPTGGDVVYDSPDDLNDNLLSAGDPGVDPSKLPGDILQMTSQPQTLLNPATFPVDPTTCKPIYPNQYLQVNTIFNVAHDAGLLTAWSDKHPVYTSFDGPEGNGITDSFDPEIDSNALEPNGTPYPCGCSWTGDNAATRQYDGYKVQAVLNWINGLNHQGTQHVGTPAIFGMNFQTVSTAEKLKQSEDVLGGPVLPGGYSSPGVPGPLLQSALAWVDQQLQTLVNAIQANPAIHGTTAIIITAKHGQSPLDPNQIKRINDAPIITNINNAWNAAGHSGQLIIVGAGTDDDVWQSYLSVRTQQAADFVKNYLWNHSAPAVTYSGSTITVPHSGLARIYAGDESARYFGVPVSDPRHPDVFGRVQVGTIYTTGSKIAEHGGSNPGDRDVPILVYAPGVVRPQSSGQWVETTQVAPTVLQLLGLDPYGLQAVRIEGTQVLPGIESFGR
jgi:Type I phosphodiesterase / nucleotide pyrophosphatase